MSVRVGVRVSVRVSVRVRVCVNVDRFWQETIVIECDRVTFQLFLCNCFLVGHFEQFLFCFFDSDQEPTPR